MNIFRQFYRSIYSPQDIASFRFQGIGKTILYLLFLSLIASIPTLYYLSKDISETVHTFTNTMDNEIPSFRISNNELLTDEKDPIVINENDLTIIVDSTGTYNANNISTSENVVAILQKEFVIVTSGQSQTMDYSSFGSLTIEKDQITSFLQAWDSMIPIFNGIMIVIFFFFMSITKAAEALIFAFFATLFARILNRKLTYAQLWKITVYSTTLPTLFFIIMDSLQTNVLNGSLLNWFITLFIVFLSIKEVPVEKQSQNNL